MITTTWSTQSPADGEVRRYVRATNKPNEFKWVDARTANGPTFRQTLRFPPIFWQVKPFLLSIGLKPNPHNQKKP